MHLDGREGQKAAEARAFGRWLGEATGPAGRLLGRALHDGRGGVGAVGRRADAQEAQGRRDRVAAQILLQAYLDAGCPENPVITGLDGTDPG